MTSNVVSLLYILGDLMSEHLTLSEGSSRYHAKKVTRTRPITSLDTWLEAYTRVLVSYKPKLAADLFRYQSFITRQSRRLKAYA